MVLRSVASALPLMLLAMSGTVLAADDKDGKDSKDGKDGKSAESTSTITIKASTEVSGYADTDHVLVLSPSIAGSISDPLAGWSVGAHYLVDVVSAASVDIVSTASSKWIEYRNAGAADGSLKLGDVTMGANGVFSSEPDYLSLAVGGTLSVDLLEKNVTPFVGFSYGHDHVGRTGLPTEFWQNKQTAAGQLGVTFVVDRSTIASLQFEAIQETGYLAKPYRYVPLFTPAQAQSMLPGASIAEVNAARLNVRPAEQLPDARHRFAITSRLGRRYSSSTLRLDERLYADTWGLMASTTDFRFTFDVDRRLMIWPHVRFHVQNEVAFWQLAYTAEPGPGGALALPTIRTGDRELSSLYTATGGGGAQFKLIDDLDHPWSLLFDIDGSYTHYLNALYITTRGAVFSTLAVEAEF